MKVKEVKVGDKIRFAGRNCKVTDIDKNTGHIIITFDIYSEGLSPKCIGWSFWVFNDEDEEITSEADGIEDEMLDNEKLFKEAMEQ